jgi:hypothetical protein
MKPLPKAGDIWKWHLYSFSAYVLLLEQKDSRVWVGLELKDGDVGDWFFMPSDMKHWKHIA